MRCAIVRKDLTLRDRDAQNPSASHRCYSRQTCTFQQSQRNHDSMHAMPPSSISHTPRCDSGKLSMPICVVPVVNNEDIRCNKDYERPSCARRHANDDMAAQQVPHHCDFKMFVSILVQDVPCAASVKFSYWRRCVQVTGCGWTLDYKRQ